MSGKQRNIRKRRALDEQEELSDGEAAAQAAAAGGEGGEPAAPRLTAEDIKALQKQRQRRTVRSGLGRAFGWGGTLSWLCNPDCTAATCNFVAPLAQRCLLPTRPVPTFLQGVDAAALITAADARERKGSGLTVGGPSAQQDVLQVCLFPASSPPSPEALLPQASRPRGCAPATQYTSHSWRLLLPWQLPPSPRSWMQLAACSGVTGLPLLESSCACRRPLSASGGCTPTRRIPTCEAWRLHSPAARVASLAQRNQARWRPLRCHRARFVAAPVMREAAWPGLGWPLGLLPCR